MHPLYSDKVPMNPQAAVDLLCERIEALERYVATLGDALNALSRVVSEAKLAARDDAPPEDDFRLW